MDIDKLKASIANIKSVKFNKEKLPLSEKSEISKLENTIQTICKAFLQNWEKDKLPLVKDWAMKLDFGIPLPVLSICGKGTQEVRFTKYLAYFLDPNKPHGLGSAFIKKVFSKEIKSLGIDEDTINNAVVDSEVIIGICKGDLKDPSCQCDIVIELDKLFIFIEQKIKSAQSPHKDTKFSQLSRYTQAIDNNLKYNSYQQIKIYLTPQNKQPENEDWKPLSHTELIEHGLAILKDNKLTQTARQNFIRFLMDIATGPYIGTEDEIIELHKISKELVDHEFTLNKYIKFSNLLNKNELILKLICEV